MGAFDKVFDNVERELNSRLETAASQKLTEINKAADARIQEVEALLEKGAKLTVVSAKGEKTLKGLKHKQLKPLLKMVAQKMPILIVGMAGTGKTHAAAQVAEALKLNFYAMSVGAQTSKSDILGYMNASGTYVPTLFRKAYEEGGVFLMDELDAGNANVLIQINSALANEYCAFPDKMVKRHKDFCFIATANTYGNGANRMYVGRNQLDAATLDRFAILNWEVDESLESSIVGEYQYGDRWHGIIKSVRKYVADQGIRLLVTPRATVRGAALLELGFDIDEAIEAALLNSVPADKQKVIKDLIMKEWRSGPVVNNKQRNQDLANQMVHAQVADFLGPIPF